MFLAPLVKDQWTINVQLYFWPLYFFNWPICCCFLMPVRHCFNHHSLYDGIRNQGVIISKENESWAFLAVCPKAGGRAWEVYMCPLEQTCLLFSEVQGTNKCKAPSVPRGECVRSQSLGDNHKSWGARYLVKTICSLIKGRS